VEERKMAPERKKGPAGRGAKLPAFDPAPSVKAALPMLKKAKARFALVGGMALAHYLPPSLQRFTKDVDLAVRYENRRGLAAIVAESGYRARRLSIGGISVREAGIAFDLVDRHPELDALFEAAIKAAYRSGPHLRVENCTVRVVPKNYLIALKLATGEEKDQRDVQALLFTVKRQGYHRLRSLIRRLLGPAGALRLDSLARRIGHPAVPGEFYQYHRAD
jgi:hypothetical protein